jgi:hypothetical protein
MFSFAHSARSCTSRIAHRPAGTAVAVVRPGNPSRWQTGALSVVSVTRAVEMPSRGTAQLVNPGAPCAGAFFQPLLKLGCHPTSVVLGRRPASRPTVTATLFRSCTSMFAVPNLSAETNSRGYR